MKKDDDRVARVCAADDAGNAAARASGFADHDPRKYDAWAAGFYGSPQPSRSEPCPHPDNPPALSDCRDCKGTGYRWKYKPR